MSEIKYNNEIEVIKLLNSVFNNNDFKVIKTDFGADKGDGYFSIMRKVTIELNGEIIHLMLKCAPFSEQFRILTPVEVAYKREIYFYQRICKDFLLFQRRYTDKTFNSIAKCYGVNNERQCEVLILEDLKCAGFHLWDRTKPMNMEHLSIVLKEYGKFHAVSFAMKHNDPILYHDLTGNMTKVFSDLKSELSFVETFRQGVVHVQQLFVEKSDVWNAINDLQSNIFKFYSTLEGERRLAMITHGDCWCTNFLFKYDENEKLLPTSVRFVDFQLTRVASPVLDLAYFLYVHCTKETLSNLENLLDIYYDSFRQHFILLNGNFEKIMTKEELKQEWIQFARFGLIMACTILRVCYTEKEEVVDLIDGANNGLKVEDVYVRKRKFDTIIDERLQDLVMHLYNNGFL